MEFNTISMIGLGYIGLPTAAVFASQRKQVIGIDVNQDAVDTINRGEIHIIEPELDIMVSAAVKNGYLRATTTPEPADAFMVAVPTPFYTDENCQHHKADLHYIKAACEAIAKVLIPGNLVVLESTSPVGATEQMATWLATARPDLTFPQTHGEASDIRIAHCPERVLPGSIVRELVENDRVIGGITPRCAKKACALYEIVVKGECVPTSSRTAEMSKLTENSFRDVNIAFANELSTIAHELEINVWELISLANRHPRVNILQPGPGVGGHCIAVDPWFIVDASPEQARLIRTAREVNDAKPEWVLSRVSDALEKLHRKRPNATRDSMTVACLGLAFKPDIDDLRESPALRIAEWVTALGCNMMVVEPNIDSLPSSLEGVKLSSIDSALIEADIIVLLVAHKSFKKIDRERLADTYLIDTCGVWEKRPQRRTASLAAQTV